MGTPIFFDLKPASERVLSFLGHGRPMAVWRLPAIIGAFFAISLLSKKAIIREFAEAQGRISSELTPDVADYFKFRICRLVDLHVH